MNRTITIKVSATGKGLQRESIELTLAPMEDQKAVELYKKIRAAIHAVIYPNGH